MTDSARRASRLDPGAQPPPVFFQAPNVADDNTNLVSHCN